MQQRARRGDPPRSSNGRTYSFLGQDFGGEAGPRFLRVVTLEEGETVHTAFFDRDFRADGR
jgi:hypothetical protein